MLYRRKKTWWIRFTAPNGQRVRRSTGTESRVLAQEFHDELKAKLWKTSKLGEKPERSWQEAVVRFIKETNHKASHVTDLVHLRWLNPYLHDKKLAEITRDVTDELTQYRLSEGVSNASVNRILALLRSILRKACDAWRWIDETPKIEFLPEPTRRIRWLTKEQAERLLKALPKHQVYAVRFALATGLRQGHIKNLVWSQVDLKRRTCWVFEDQARKGKKTFLIPLNDDAIEILTALKGNHPKFVFTFRGKPVGQMTTKAWYKTLKEVGIEDFRWHDLRHTWASWHVQSGTPINVLQELGAWENVAMVRRYAHLGESHLAEYANNSCQL